MEEYLYDPKRRKKKRTYDPKTRKKSRTYYRKSTTTIKRRYDPRFSIPSITKDWLGVIIGGVLGKILSRYEYAKYPELNKYTYYGINPVNAVIGAGISYFGKRNAYIKGIGYGMLAQSFEKTGDIIYDKIKESSTSTTAPSTGSSTAPITAPITIPVLSAPSTAPVLSAPSTAPITAPSTTPSTAPIHNTLPIHIPVQPIHLPSMEHFGSKAIGLFDERLKGF